MSGRITVRGHPHVLVLRSLFSPIALAFVFYLPMLLLYAVSSDSVFASEFESRKALTWSGAAYFVLALLLFIAGAKAGGDSTRTRPAGGDQLEIAPAQRRSLAVLLEAALAISIAAYLVWFTRGVIRAGGIGPLLEVWRDDPHRIKAEFLTTLPGVTTLTQLAVAAVPLALAFRLLPKGSALRVLLALVIALSSIRAVLFNERLAFIELLVPVLFLVLAPRKVTVPRVAVYAAAFLLAVVTFFAVTELRRTYAYTGDFSASRATTRFLGYYVTSLNNGVVVVDEYPARTPIYSSGEFLWRFPGARDLHLEHVPALGTVSLRYGDLFGVDPETFWPRAFAEQGLDYEFNVFTAPGYLAADFGWWALLAVLIIGLVSGRLYAKSDSSPFHRGLYAVWLVGLLEFMRILYFTDTRVFPAYLVFAAAYLIVSRRRPAPARRTPPLTPEATASATRAAP